MLFDVQKDKYGDDLAKLADSANKAAQSTGDASITAYAASIGEMFSQFSTQLSDATSHATLNALGGTALGGQQFLQSITAPINVVVQAAGGNSTIDIQAVYDAALAGAQAGQQRALDGASNLADLLGR